MTGIVYAKKGKRFGWVVGDNVFFIPKNISKVGLTEDPDRALVFDVDNVEGFKFLNAMIEDGYTVVIGSSHIHKKPALPSASPFTPIN